MPRHQFCHICTVIQLDIDLRHPSVAVLPHPDPGYTTPSIFYHCLELPYFVFLKFKIEGASKLRNSKTYEMEATHTYLQVIRLSAHIFSVFSCAMAHSQPQQC